MECKGNPGNMLDKFFTHYHQRRSESFVTTLRKYMQYSINKRSIPCCVANCSTHVLARKYIHSRYQRPNKPILNRTGFSKIVSPLGIFNICTEGVTNGGISLVSGSSSSFSLHTRWSTDIPLLLSFLLLLFVAIIYVVFRCLLLLLFFVVCVRTRAHMRSL